MRELKFKIHKVPGTMFNLSKTSCPFKLYKEKGNGIYSVNCKKCIYYIGKYKNKNSILCSGDEINSINISPKKIFLTEKINFENASQAIYVI